MVTVAIKHFINYFSEFGVNIMGFAYQSRVEITENNKMAIVWYSYRIFSKSEKKGFHVRMPR